MKYVNQVREQTRWLVLIGVLALPWGALAQTTNSAVTGLTLGTPGPFGGSKIVGFSFSTSLSNVEVTALGRYMVSGNSQTHELSFIEQTVGIYPNTYGGPVLATVNLNMGAGTPDALGFKYAELSSPIILVPNQTYILVSQEGSTFGGDSFYDQSQATATMANGFSEKLSLYNFDSTSYAVGQSVTNLNWQAGAPTSNAYGPLNFEFVVVPEPSMLGLVLCGLLTLHWRRQTTNRR